MKTLIVKCFYFCAVFATAIKLIGSLDHINRVDQNVVRIDQLKQIERLEWLFVGNSYTYTGINPIQIAQSGILSYSLGINGAGPKFYQILLDDFFVTHQHYPEKVFLLVSPMTFSHFADNFSASRIHRYVDEPLSNEYIAWRYDVNYPQLIQKSFVHGATNVFNGIKKLHATTSTHQTLKKTIETHMGFIPSQKQYSSFDWQLTFDTYHSLQDDQFDLGKVAKLVKLADELKAKGIDVVFYELPSFKVLEHFSKQYLQDYSKAIAQLNLSQHQFIGVDVPNRAKYFRNIDHLNSQGAQLATSKIIERVQSSRVSISQKKDSHHLVTQQ